MPGVVPQDIMDAILQRLRTTECAQLFGDTWDASTQLGIQKFYADYADSTSYPLAIATEPQESYQFMTASAGNEIPYLADGLIAVTVQATDRYQARVLAKAVARALNDAPLVWVGSQLMYFRLFQAAFIPNPPTAAGTPTVFLRQITFSYETQEQL